MARFISRSAFSRLAGVTPAAITIASRSELAPACDADRIDRDHDVAIAYLARHRDPDAQTKPRHGGKRRTSKPTAIGQKATIKSESLGAEAGEERPADPDDIERYANLTLREIAETFRTERRFRDWLDALKKIEDIRKTRLDNDETEGGLISRELIKTHVFGAIDAANRRLLSDAPKTIARRVYAAAKSSASIEEAERTIREIIGSHLKPVKATAARVLRGA